jgi:Tol biopolymer transport system component
VFSSSIETVLPSGRGRRVLHAFPVEQGAGPPVWSPSGKRFAYSVLDADDVRSSVYVVRRDGTGRRKLTGNGAVDDWSVNGRILFHREGSKPGLYSMGAGGKRVRRLTSPPRFADDPGRVVFDRDGSWSPDGRQIAFARSSVHLEDVYLANADGSSPHAFAQGADGPAWSPNGKRLAYVSEFGENVHIERADGTGPIHRPMPRPQHGTSSCGSESFGTAESGGMGRLAWQPRPPR